MFLSLQPPSFSLSWKTSALCHLCIMCVCLSLSPSPFYLTTCHMIYYSCVHIIFSPLPFTCLSITCSHAQAPATYQSTAPLNFARMQAPLALPVAAAAASVAGAAKVMTAQMTASFLQGRVASLALCLAARAGARWWRWKWGPVQSWSGSPGAGRAAAPAAASTRTCHLLPQGRRQRLRWGQHPPRSCRC